MEPLKEEAEEMRAEAAGKEKAAADETDEMKIEETPNPVPVTPHREDWALAVMIVLASYVYYNLLIPGGWILDLAERGVEIGYGTLLNIFTLLFIAAGLYYASKKGRKPGRDSMIYLALTAAAALWCLIFQASVQPIGIYVVGFLHCVAVYWLAALAGNRRGGCLDEWALNDLARGLFGTPFSHFGSLWSTMNNLRGCLVHSQRKHSKRIGQILLGVCLSLPILCIVVPLLVSADREFARVVFRILENTFRVFTFRPWMELLSTLLIAMYLFGMFYGTFRKDSLMGKTRTSFSQVVMVSFLTVFVAVYFFFFAVKVMGISGAMRQIEDGTLWTSTYARDGFFELCGIAAINFLMFSLVKWYSPKAVWLMKITLTILGGQTLAFICLAFSKMSFYISHYGLTFKRVFTCWFMGVLFITFGLLMAELWKKFNGLRIAVMVGAVSFLALAYSNMPRWMIAYNTSFQSEWAVECRQVTRDGYAAVIYEDREYVPFCSIDAGCRGDYLGYIGQDKNDKLYKYEGYSKREWIINDSDSGLTDECVLLREVHVWDIPEGLSSEYEWNKPENNLTQGR